MKTATPSMGLVQVMDLYLKLPPEERAKIIADIAVRLGKNDPASWVVKEFGAARAAPVLRYLDGRV